MRYLTITCLLLALFACGCETDILTGDEAGTIQWPDLPEPEAPTATTMETAVLNLVNDVRASGCYCGSTRMPSVPALRLDDRLSAAARAHAADMAGMRKMQHAGSDGSKVGARVTRTGFKWRNVGENIAWNYRDAQHVMQGWLASAGHCRNIMSANFTHLGMGEQDRYWAQVFAR